MRVVRSALAVGVVAAGFPPPLEAQSSPLDTASLPSGPFTTLRALLEKTIFQVDVLTLEVRFGEETAERLEAIVRGLGDEREARDSVAAAAVRATDAWARIVFQREVSLEQFLDGVDGNMRKALAAGIITEPEYRLVADGLPVWFSFLEQEGIHDGDRILYRIAGDALRTVFQTAAGEVRLDQTDVGPERRRTLLGSWFAPKSEFRDGLIRSLYETSPDG